MTTAQRTIGILAAALVLGFAGLAESWASDSVPPALPVDELTRAIRAVGSAGNAGEAATAYATGCSITRRSSKLQLAYLRRLLQLGRPDLAQTPARELLGLDPNSGLALGTIAYEHLRKSRYMVALRPAIRAAVLDRANQPICQNAAQLTAWYEAGKRPAVPPDIVRAMKDLPSDSKPFAAAYKRAKEGFKGLAAISEDKMKLAAEAEKEAEAAEKEEEGFKKKLESAGKTYDQQRQRLSDAQRDLKDANYDIQRASSYDARRSAQNRYNSIARRIRDIRREMARQEKEGLKIRGDWEKARKEAQKKRKAAATITAEAKAVTEGMPGNFGWLPPAVDGVCTPDATAAKPKAGGDKPGKPGAAASSYLVSAQPTSAPAPAPTTSIEQRLAAAQAADKLQLAKICLDSDEAAMKARARELLEEIVSQFASTPSAAEARDLLSKMQK